MSKLLFVILFLYSQILSCWENEINLSRYDWNMPTYIIWWKSVHSIGWQRGFLCPKNAFLDSQISPCPWKLDITSFFWPIILRISEKVKLVINNINFGIGCLWSCLFNYKLFVFKSFLLLLKLLAGTSYSVSMSEQCFNLKIICKSWFAQNICFKSLWNYCCYGHCAYGDIHYN